MRRTNTHHLVWQANKQFGLRKQVRDLPCAQVRIDIEVHRALHMIYAPPALLPLDVCEKLIARHDNHQCACYEDSQSQPIPILGIRTPDD